MLASLEKFQTEAEERGNAFLLSVLEKQHMRLKALFERRVVSIMIYMPLRPMLTCLSAERPNQDHRGDEAYE